MKTKAEILIYKRIQPIIDKILKQQEITQEEDIILTEFSKILNEVKPKITLLCTNDALCIQSDVPIHVTVKGECSYKVVASVNVIVNS